VTALDDAAERARATYEAAADTYDAPANGFWAVHGRRTVELAGAGAGSRVLDVPCGSGASANPAARLGAAVVAVDLAPRLLELVRAKAADEDLAVETLERDMRATGFADASFDAVICVHGVFFVPDRPTLLRELWRMVAPGGTLAVTTWGPGVLEPGATAFWAAVGVERPDLVRGFNPWDDLVEPEQLLGLFAEAGIPGASAQLELHDQALARPEEWWDVVMGSGFRGTVEQLDPAARERVRARNVAALAGVGSVRASAVYARAAKPVSG
jgi:2-polyprenyl-3-methyl-5-hydroxy-6-metoxy-1,4-benzoquinol methylase